MVMKFTLCTIILCLSNFIYSQTIIHGVCKERAGTELLIIKHKDLISFLPDTICKCKINDKGEFNCSFQLNETQPVYIPLEKNKGIIIAEPGTKYNIDLPGSEPKTKAEELNPYYEESYIYLAKAKSPEGQLSHMVKNFETELNNYIDKRFYEIYKFAKKSGVDTVITYFDTTFKSNNKYFNEFKYYKFAMLRYFAYIRQEKYLTKEYYLNKPILYYNTAYMQLFNQVYENYFRYYSKTSEGENITINIAKSKSITELKKTLSSNMSLDNEMFKELVILKGLHDSYFAGDFKKPVILQTLDSVTITSAVPLHREIAKNIIHKITMNDYEKNAPNISLPSVNGKKINLEDFNGKYVYLSFIDINSHACIEELELIKELFSKKYSNLAIASVVIDKNPETVASFCKKNNINWTVMVCSENSPLLSQYKIKALPSYYLIGKDGKFQIPVVKSMKEGFEEYFYKTYIKK